MKSREFKSQIRNVRIIGALLVALLILDSTVCFVAPADAQSAQPRLTWTLPADWREVAPGDMRVASFKAKGQNGSESDVSVLQLSGSGGGDINNVNRWRGQVSLPPIAEDALTGLAEKVDVGGSDATLFDLAGTEASGDKTRVLAAISHHNGASWYFKITGDDETVAKQKPAFLEFLKSLKFSDAGAELPPNHPPVGGTMTGLPMQSSSVVKPQWKIPAGWTEEPVTPMLVAKFSAGNNSARTDITVSSFPGDVGGLLANLNRWRRQVNLQAVSEAQLAKSVKNLPVQSDTGALVELVNPDGQSPGLIGVALPHEGQTWFFKMIGDAKVVAREKEAFIQFVKSVKLSNAL